MIILFVFSLQIDIQKSITLWARVPTRARPKKYLFYFIYIITLVILTTPLCYLTQNGLL